MKVPCLKIKCDFNMHSFKEEDTNFPKHLPKKYVCKYVSNKFI